MSVITEMLDRLSGISTVRTNLDRTMDRVEKLAEKLMDHEVRIRMLEQNSPTPPRRPGFDPLLPPDTRR